ncbi:GNAT family N-acetyltransferase [Emcibacter nanhaiensis]|uniref:GNAT family N-acetyltransferase n=1 Tax=Emcibacter nanhaiensis TaxID=1505037 RepID=A0A501PP33_9PROT|nr:GNAT family N-acetyltransferase [Emcibacter nanhaiensis]TPD61862.1 GNAT family N-acetyltransferase [Emcibacter nanhaiensis]
MVSDKQDNPSPRLEVEVAGMLENVALEQLCVVTREAIDDGIGFGWLNQPPQKTLENYWRGVMLMPDRTLFIARMDGQVCGACQLVRPPTSNEAGAFAAEIVNFFLAPWARGFDLAKKMLKEVEEYAHEQGFRSLNSNMRADQQAAIAVCEWLGMKKWGIKERYAMIDGKFVPGYYYTKDID